MSELANLSTDLPIRYPTADSEKVLDALLRLP